MNIVNKLTLRHVRLHKKRTVLTLLAIIVSVAMVMAVFTSSISFFRFFHDATLAYDGNWHASFDYDAPPDMDALAREPDVELYARVRPTVNITPASAAGDTDLIGSVLAADEGILELRSIRLTAGTYPKAAGELLVNQKYLDANELSWAVGDTVRVACVRPGDETQHWEETTYTIVGVADRNGGYLAPANAGLTAYDAAVPEDDGTSVTVRYRKLNNAVYDKIEQTAADTGAAAWQTNTELFFSSYIVRDNHTLFSVGGFVGVILCIIVVSSVFMIYDSFAVSYQERAKYLGMLASVGATKRQKRQSVYFEGFLLGVIGIPAGIAAGIGGIAITFAAIQETFLSLVAVGAQAPLRVVVNPFVICGSVLVSATTIFISSYIPARKASKTTAISAIRQTDAAQARRMRLKNPAWVQRLFGFEGALAVKNYKRNARRSRNVVFALTMSAVLFISVTNFSSMLSALMADQYGTVSADFTVLLDRQADSATVEAFLRGNDGVNRTTGEMGPVDVPLQPYADRLTEVGNAFCQADDNAPLRVFGMDSASFDAYLRQLGKGAARYHEAGQPMGVLYNVVAVRADDKTTVSAAFQPGVAGATLAGDVEISTSDGANATSAFRATVGCVTEEAYKGGAFSPQGYSSPALILPFDTFADCFADIPDAPVYYSVWATEYEAVMEQVKSFLAENHISCHLNDLHSDLGAMNAVLTIAQVFIYGFITLISLIAVLNIINTIANSMNERRREFVMIRSVGMTPGSFRRMIYIECLRYGVHALLWATPVSIGIHFLMYRMLAVRFDYGFRVTPVYYLIAAAAIFLIIFLALWYSMDKIRSDSMIETLKEDIT